jgi:hypothetical protein
MMNFKKVINQIVATAALTLTLHANASLIEVNPTANGNACCADAERGYYFTAPSILDFSSFWLNTSSGLSSNYNLDILLLNTPPPEFSASTTDYVTLGSWDGLSGIFNTDISVAAGSIIGVLAWDVDSSQTPYADLFSQDINGTTVAFSRLIRQSFTNGDPVSTETGEPIGSIGFTVNSIPEPSTVAIFALGLLGFTLRIKQNTLN